MKKICYVFFLGMTLIVGLHATVVSADGGSLGSKSDVTFYGKYEYPKDPEKEESSPAELTPERPVNNQNNHAIIPQLGDVDTTNFSYLGIILIFIATILGKRKGITHENKSIF